MEFCSNGIHVLRLYDVIGQDNEQQGIMMSEILHGSNSNPCGFNLIQDFPFFHLECRVKSLYCVTMVPLLWKTIVLFWYGTF